MEGEGLGELEKLQTDVLHRVTELELKLKVSPHSRLPSFHLPPIPSFDHNCTDSDTTETRLSNILRSNGIRDFTFKKVPSDYYDWPLEVRRDVIGAASVDHLCKSIVLA